MSLRVYNTLSQQKELFEPVRPGKVGMYLCGPTVYKPPHIGHMVGPVIFDAIKRYLVFKGFEVTWVVNITDVDDKLIAAAAKAGTDMRSMAEKYAAEYFEVLKLYGIDTIDQFPKASEHIAEMIAMCERLIGKGHAYAADGNVWFAVDTDADYGKLSHRVVEAQEAGQRATESAGKRNPKDFALWKAAKAGEPAWDSPWGRGRPGWHIECSAMSMKYLGETFDMHGGGMDLKFPHHENEIAQSECCTGRPFVKYWMHNGLTRIKTKSAGGEWRVEDMHATTGNVVSARELVEQHGADLVRYLLLSTHYRSPIEFSDEVIASAKKAMGTFTRVFERVERIVGKPVGDDTPEMDRAASALIDGAAGGVVKAVMDLKLRFLEMMDDDFNTAGAIAVMHELAGAVNAFIEQNQLERERPQQLVEAVAAAAATLRRLGQVLGLFRVQAAAKPAGQDQALSEKLMQLLITLRQQARNDKNFALADSIRKGLTGIGITLEDRADGTAWRV